MNKETFMKKYNPTLFIDPPNFKHLEKEFAKDLDTLIQSVKKEQKEKDVIEVLNFVASFDGIIENEDDIKYILQKSIDRFIGKKKKCNFEILESYPIKIRRKAIKE